MLPFRVDPATLRWRHAAVATAVLAVAIGALVLVGTRFGATVFGALLTVVAFPVGSPRRGARPVVWFGFLGSLATLIGLVAEDGRLVSTLMVAVVAYAGTLAAAIGPVAGARGTLLTIWAVTVVSVGGDPSTAMSSALGFAFGCAVAALVLRRLANAGATDRPAASPAPGSGTPTALTARDLARAARGPIGRFALIKAIVVAITVPVGVAWFPEHPYWLAMTVIVVAQAGRAATVAQATIRSVATIAGVGIAAAVTFGLPPGPGWLAVAVLATLFLEVLFLTVNALWSATFLATFIVLASTAAGSGALSTGWERVLATLAGAAAALGVVALHDLHRSGVT